MLLNKIRRMRKRSKLRHYLCGFSLNLSSLSQLNFQGRYYIFMATLLKRLETKKRACKVGPYKKSTITEEINSIILTTLLIKFQHGQAKPKVRLDN